MIKEAVKEKTSGETRQGSGEALLNTEEGHGKVEI